MSEIIRYKDIDLNSINYSKPTNQQNAYFGSITYKNNPFEIQSSRLKIIEIKDKSIKVSVEPDDFSFYDTLVKLDDHNLASTYKKSKDWFNKELPMDILETMYKRLSKPFKKNTIPEIELKLNSKCQVYDVSNQLIPLNNLSVNSIIICLVNIKGLKFLKRDYYCDLGVFQMKLINPVQKNITNKCLIEDDQIIDSKYDYEILDEEVIQLNLQKNIVIDKIKHLEKKIENDKVELINLQKELMNLN